MASLNIIQWKRFSPALPPQHLLHINAHTHRGTNKNCYIEYTLSLSSPSTLLPPYAVKPSGTNLIKSNNIYNKDTEERDLKKNLIS